MKLLKAAYRLADNLLNHERYNLSDQQRDYTWRGFLAVSHAQIRRASCSILLNISEGYGRYHYLEHLRFLYIARGSLAETLSAFVIAVMNN